MARQFTRASTEDITYQVSGQLFQNFAYGTIAAMIRTASDGTLRGIIGNTRSGGGDDGFAFYVESGNDQLEYWSASSNAACRNFNGQSVNAGSWTCVAMCKATGAVPVRFHMLRLDSGGWSHENGNNNSMVDNASFQLPVRIGRLEAFVPNTYFDGDIAAVMVLNRRELSDGEAERLPAGGWDRYLVNQDDFLQEFPSGRDTFGSGATVPAVRSTCRNRMAADGIDGTSRSAVTDPPGFKFSRLTRRR